jgi:hypothetical protein
MRSIFGLLAALVALAQASVAFAQKDNPELGDSIGQLRLTVRNRPTDSEAHFRLVQAL